MFRQPYDPLTVILAGYVRRSSEMQKDNFSIDAQKRAITEAAKVRGLPEPVFERGSAGHPLIRDQVELSRAHDRGRPDMQWHL